MAATRFNPSGRVRRRSIASFVGLISVLALVAGCGCSVAPPPVHTDPSVAVIRSVLGDVARDVGFGNNPYSRVVISLKRADGSPLSARIKTAIARELQDLGDIEVTTSKVRSGEASIELGRVVETSKEARITVELVCGSMCGRYGTYTLEQGAAGGWVVTGVSGLIYN